MCEFFVSTQRSGWNITYIVILQLLKQQKNLCFVNHKNDEQFYTFVFLTPFGQHILFLSSNQFIQHIDFRTRYDGFAKRYNGIRGVNLDLGKSVKWLSMKWTLKNPNGSFLEQGSPNFFEGGPDNNETISLGAGQIIQS